MGLKNLKPLNDRVLIKPIELGERRNGAILMMTSDDDAKFGTVVAVGPGRMTEFGHMINVSNVKVGDTVVIPRIGTQRIVIDGEEYWTIAEKDLVAVADYVEE